LQALKCSCWAVIDVIVDVILPELNEIRSFSLWCGKIDLH